ncbi:MAG: DUF3109 family protein [Crocinitomicaceae bacterium]|nr:DUF3109 family protein [Crocinitomicaceae bacterium]
MIIVGSSLVSEEIFDEHFVCDLSACKGACCVEGESGAPLEPEELDELKVAFEDAKVYMTEEGIEAIQEKGHFEIDLDGDLVTPLIGDQGACAYVFFDKQGIAKCSLEKVYNEGKTKWKKPISCHLYPIRLSQLTDYTGVNYHRWPICAPACECGSKLQVPVFKFLKEPLVRRFGEKWYAELEEVFIAWKAASQDH